MLSAAGAVGEPSSGAASAAPEVDERDLDDEAEDPDDVR